jgi:Tol biopolymer transport system component
MDDPSIYVVRRTGGTPRLVVTDAVDPDWAPSANRIVFHRPSDGGIYTINGRGRYEHFITQGTQPAWSPDGRWIAYVYDGDIWKIRVNIFGRPAGDPVNVTNDPDIGDFKPSWSRENQAIVFHSSREGDVDIYTVPADGGTPSRLTGIVGQGDFDPSFSNLGLFVAYAGFTEPEPAALVPGSK